MYKYIMLIYYFLINKYDLVVKNPQTDSLLAK